MTVSTKNAPHGLDLLIDFVNTLDVEASVDALDCPSDLTTWLSTRGLLSETGESDATSFRVAIALRHALRQVLIAHNRTAKPSTEALSVLDRVAETGRLSVRFTDPTQTVSFEPRESGIAGALAAILAPAASASADGSWLRVKACAADDCRWAFYDLSRNRSGRWCDMAVCGNRTKVRSYRRRVSDS